MNFLQKRILDDAVVKEGNVLKVDNFLNHQIDVSLLEQIGEEFKRRFADKKINKILTIEASGIAIAVIVARYFDVPVVFAKKAKSININGDIYQTEVESFTHKSKNQVVVSKQFINEDDRILIIDDFLAHGCAMKGLIDIIQKANATIEGIGIVIEKGFQSGGKVIRDYGYQVESLAIIESMNSNTGEIVFRKEAINE